MWTDVEDISQTCSLYSSSGLHCSLFLSVSQVRLQTDGLDGKKLYRGTIHCVKQIAKQEGVRVYAVAGTVYTSKCFDVDATKKSKCLLCIIHKYS